MPPFNNGLLLLARQFCGLTQRELGDRVALSHPQIAYYESGKREPRSEIVEALAAALHVTPEFFFRPATIEFKDSQFNFRDQITATERLRRRVMSYANLFTLSVQHIKQDVELPALNLPQLSDQAATDMELAASAARAHWGMSANAPIGRVITVIENAGVVVTPIRLSVEEVEKVDALSGFARNGIVLINVSKESTTRSRFNMAHEIAHGILHADGVPRPLADKEREANSFAGAFLLPKEAFVRDFRLSQASVDGLIEMKMRWGVSLQAILMRARELDLLNAAEIRVWFMRLARNGWRKVEPAEPDPHSELPEIFDAAAKEWHHSPGDRLARELNWTTELVAQVTGLRSQRFLEVEKDQGTTVVSLDSWRVRAAK